jgi:PKD repeat protein
MVGEVQGESHQISHVSFGPDSRLYVHNGDGFDASTAQNLNSFRGKILRLNRDGTPPVNNPYFNAQDGLTARDYVYAYGFRNPFGGAWRALDLHLYEVENGPSVDRFARVAPGVNYLWDGTDQSMLNYALYNWYPIQAPVNVTFVQPNTFNGSGFPTSTWHNAFVTESGPTWAAGAVPNGKSISEFPLDPAGVLTAQPTPLVKYTGFGKATAVGLAAGPDGLYFSDLYKDLDYLNPTDPGATIWRIRFVGEVNFSADVRLGAVPLTTHFTPLTTVPAPTAWLWDFGDGTYSTLPQPVHTYNAPGSYHVRLTVFSQDGLISRQRNDFVRVAPRVALIGGSSPPTTADQSIADYLTSAGYFVTHFDDEPQNRPSATELAAAFQVALISASVYAPNIGDEFSDVPLPLVVCEPTLLNAGEVPLASAGLVIPSTRVIRIIANDHPLTADLPLGYVLAYTAGAAMSIGRPQFGPGVRVLALRGSSIADAAVMAAETGAILADGSQAPARRVFLFFSDSTWLQSTPAAQSLLGRAVYWTTMMNADLP